METRDFISWGLDYTTGITEIDDQHRELMDLANEMIIHSSASQAERKIFIQKVVFIAGNLLANHFNTEERVLTRTNYDRLAEHKKQHEILIGKVKAVLTEVGNNNEEIVLFNLTNTFKENFLSHILFYDKDAKDFFQTGISYNTHTGIQAGVI